MQNSVWLEFSFSGGQLDEDSLVGVLYELPFNTFHLDDNVFKGFMNIADFTKEVQEALDLICKEFGLKYKTLELDHVDWNKEWESNFDPVIIDNVCSIRAVFHKDIDSQPVNLLISPKMAFGTGHHQTTAGMLELMSKLDWRNKCILDFGSGTGILAIYALKRDALNVIAIDNEAPAVENILENAALNGVDGIEAIFGDKASIPDTKFDIILANITKNVIIDALPSLKSALSDGGKLLMSGFFEDDLASIEKEALPLKLRKHHLQGNWCVALFED